MDFNENGPVPWETEQTGIEDLVYGHLEDYKAKDFIAIALTDDQIDDLMENPHQPEEEELWTDCIFQIDIEQEAEFLKLASNPDFEISMCISKKRGLYSVDCITCTEDRGKRVLVKKESSLKKMIDRGMIKQIFTPKDFFINDEWEDGKLRFEFNFSSAPYYIYGQPYWTELLAERLNIPTNPVKLSQFPPKLRNKVLRVPIKFSECKRFQIAEWIPCGFSCSNSDEVITVNGFVYQLIVFTDGSKAYVYTSMEGVGFFEYCSEKGKYNCQECSHACCTVYGNEYSDKPTVMFVFHPFSEYDYAMTVKSDVIIRHSIRLPFLHKIPYKRPAAGSWMLVDDAMKFVDEEMLRDFFLKNHKHFEDIVQRFNPQVIILEENTKDVLSQQYAIDDRHIIINGHAFPCYLSSEIEENREEITKLALLPYRGIEMPYIISVEEMEQYKNEHNAAN